MISLYVEAENVTKLLNKTLDYFGLKLNTQAKTIEDNDKPEAPPPAPPADPKVTAITKPKKRPGRPPKKTAPPAPPAPPAPVDPFETGTPPDTTPVVTFEDMKKAIQEVVVPRKGDVDNAGFTRAQTILGKYGVRKINDVKPEHYAPIIEDCKTA